MASRRRQNIGITLCFSLFGCSLKHAAAHLHVAAVDLALERERGAVVAYCTLEPGEGEFFLLIVVERAGHRVGAQGVAACGGGDLYPLHGDVLVACGNGVVETETADGECCSHCGIVDDKGIGRGCGGVLVSRGRVVEAQGRGLGVEQSGCGKDALPVDCVGHIERAIAQVKLTVEVGHGDTAVACERCRREGIVVVAVVVVELHLGRVEGDVGAVDHNAWRELNGAAGVVERDAVGR